MKNRSKMTFLEDPQRFAERLGLKFRDLLLLNRALTHSSYLNEHPEALEDNERLEFLGDAVLDFSVGAWLYNNFPEMKEGELTRLRAALVQTEQLAQFAKSIGLGNAMRLGQGETLNGGNQRDALLCDTFEAVIGAVYLDSGLEQVSKLIFPMLADACQSIITNHTHEDPKSTLQEWAQSRGFSPPQYLVSHASGPDHQKVFEVDVYINSKKQASGRGHSKQAAEKAAATNALKKI